MNATQLKADLAIIENGVDRSDASKAVKHAFKELIEWQRAFVDQFVADDGIVTRVDSLEGAVDELIDGADEGISQETADILMAAHTQARLLCATMDAFLRGDGEMDDLTRKRFAELVRNTAQATEVAIQVIGDLTVPVADADELEEESEDDDDEGDDADAVAEDETVESEDA